MKNLMKILSAMLAVMMLSLPFAALAEDASADSAPEAMGQPPEGGFPGDGQPPEMPGGMGQPPEGGMPGGMGGPAAWAVPAAAPRSPSSLTRSRPTTGTPR